MGQDGIVCMEWNGMELVWVRLHIAEDRSEGGNMYSHCGV